MSAVYSCSDNERKRDRARTQPTYIAVYVCIGICACAKWSSPSSRSGEFKVAATAAADRKGPYPRGSLKDVGSGRPAVCVNVRV